MAELSKDKTSNEELHVSKSEIPKIALIQVLCTIAIILSMYAFSNRTILVIGNMMETQEYTKVGGEENYKLLQEIQKDQVNSMIQDYSITNPEYIDQIKKKIRGGDLALESTTQKKLTSEEITSLKSQTAIFGNTGAMLTLIEFSDFTCTHCQDFHNKKIISQIVDSSSGSINRIFKNIPGRKNQEGLLLAQNGRCILTLTGTTAYSDYIDKTFVSYGESTSSSNNSGSLNDFVDSLGIDSGKMADCQTSPETKVLLDREFGQSIYLGITVTPTTLVLNSKTGNYQKIEGNIDAKTLQSAIDQVKNE